MKVITITSLILLFSLSANAKQELPTQAMMQPQSNDVLCELLGIGCSTTDTRTKGSGKRPPRAP